MTGLSMNIGLKALLSARTVLDTIGHNVANANTPGYSRQRVGLANATSLPRGNQYIGSGVDVTGIRREVDALLHRRLLDQRGVQGALDVRMRNMGQLESFFTTSGDGTFAGLLDGFFNAASELSTAPADRVLRTGFVQAAESAAQRLNEIDAQAKLALSQVTEQIDVAVDEVNQLAGEIARLNIEIGAATRQGNAPNDMLDRRDQLVDQLAELVDVTTVTAADQTMSVLVSGNMLVSASRAVEMQTGRDANGDPQISMAASQGRVRIGGGTLGGLLELAASDLHELRGEFGDFTRQLALATNRIHSTGMPSSGPFTTLRGDHRLQDVDQDGKVTDELLSNAGLPFDVQSGSLWINVEDFATGNVTKSRIEIRSTHTTVEDLLDEINSLDHVSADLDGAKRLRIVAQSGYGFDFSPRVEPTPDVIGSFGGGRASLNGGSAEPFALVDGDTLTITADPGGAPVPFTVTFDTADFVEISEATAEEVAAVINADASAIANGITASAVSGELAPQTAGTGVQADLRVDGGSSTAALGLTSLVGSVVTGHVQSVDPVLKGAYVGESDQTLTFRPTSDGSVGSTLGLTVEVYDADGQVVTVLDVGAGYVPGTDLEVLEGVTVSFGLGDLSSTNGDLFEADLVARSDTADVLGALGLNSFFTIGADGGIAVREALLKSPELVSTSFSGSGGDSRLMLELLSMKDDSQAELGGASLDQRYGELVGGVGFQVASTTGALAVSESVLFNLELQRDQISGVDVDEELVDMVAFEQAYQAATRYISVVSQLSDELLALL